MNCYCCSGKTFAECCQPFIKGISKPSTAEELMRSRYSAYAAIEIEYLLRTTHPSTRKFHDSKTIKEWAESGQWQKLEIISTEQGGIKDKKGKVEFKAYYLNAGNQLQIHHEHSNFARELGKWFFVDGKVVKASL